MAADPKETTNQVSLLEQKILQQLPKLSFPKDCITRKPTVKDFFSMLHALKFYEHVWLEHIKDIDSHKNYGCAIEHEMAVDSYGIWCLKTNALLTKEIKADFKPILESYNKNSQFHQKYKQYIMQSIDTILTKMRQPNSIENVIYKNARAKVKFNLPTNINSENQTLIVNILQTIFFLYQPTKRDPKTQFKVLYKICTLADALAILNNTELKPAVADKARKMKLVNRSCFHDLKVENVELQIKESIRYTDKYINLIKSNTEALLTSSYEALKQNANNLVSVKTKDDYISKAIINIENFSESKNAHKDFNEILSLYDSYKFNMQELNLTKTNAQIASMATALATINTALVNHLQGASYLDIIKENKLQITLQKASQNFHNTAEFININTLKRALNNIDELSANIAYLLKTKLGDSKFDIDNKEHQYIWLEQTFIWMRINQADDYENAAMLANCYRRLCRNFGYKLSEAFVEYHMKMANAMSIIHQHKSETKSKDEVSELEIPEDFKEKLEREIKARIEAEKVKSQTEAPGTKSKLADFIMDNPPQFISPDPVDDGMLNLLKPDP